MALGRLGRAARLVQALHLGVQVLVDLGQALLELGHLTLGDGALLARLHQALLRDVQLGLQLGQRLAAGPDLLLHHGQLLLVRGVLVVGAAAQVGGVLLGLGLQRGVLLVGGGALPGDLPLGAGPQLAELALDIGLPLRDLLLGLRPRRLDLLLHAHPGRLDHRLGLGLGVLGLLGVCLLHPLQLVLGALHGGLAVGPHPVGPLLCLGEDLLRLGLVVLHLLRRGGGDLLGLLLGQVEDLVHHRAQVAERGPLHLRRALAQLGQLGQVGVLPLEPLGQLADLHYGALALGRQRRHLAVELREVVVDLALVVPAQGDLEVRPCGQVVTLAVLLAQRHTSSSIDRESDAGG
ncbi:hypothetical protein ACFQY4_33535 [Catellatospora bangladeshensis]|uniref:hypothetical protein n=1 Tax=Catellatospora bangladeshensis TaxID=310355 RepID=UPI00361EF85E